MGAHKDRLIQAADLLGMAPDDLLTLLDTMPAWHGAPDTFQGEDGHPRAGNPQAPEGFAVVAHWSAAHAGVNVEIDAPEGLPLTVHVNDWRMLNVIIGTDDPASYGDLLGHLDAPAAEAATEMLDDMLANSAGSSADWQRERAEALVRENFPV